MRMTSREGDILAGVLRLLALRGFPAWRCNAGVAMVRGRPIRLAPARTADVLGIVPGSGRFLAVACRRPGGRLRPAQQAFLGTIRDAGGVALVVSDLADSTAKLRPWRPWTSDHCRTSGVGLNRCSYR